MSRLGIGLDLLPTILFTKASEQPSFLSMTARGINPRAMDTFAIAIEFVILGLNGAWNAVYAGMVC